MTIRERSSIKGYGRVDSRVANHMNDNHVSIEEACYVLGYKSVNEAMSTPAEKEWDANNMKILENDGYFDDLVRE